MGAHLALTPTDFPTLTLPLTSCFPTPYFATILSARFVDVTSETTILGHSRDLRHGVLGGAFTGVRLLPAVGIRTVLPAVGTRARDLAPVDMGGLGFSTAGGGELRHVGWRYVSPFLMRSPSILH